MNTKNFGTLMIQQTNMKLKSINGSETDNYQGNYINNCFVALGTNTTPPTYSDYAFTRITTLSQSSNIVNKATWTTATQTFDGVLQVITAYQNTGSTNVTVNEVGIITAYSTSELDNPSQAALIAREVLETPVVVQPGETYAFSMTIK